MVNIILCWICWLFWAGLPIITAYPVSSSLRTGTLIVYSIFILITLLMRGYFAFIDLSYNHSSSKWEQYWIQYTLGLLSVTATAFTLVGCLCCRRPRRPKGFQVINCHFYIIYNK